jgi:hypothetical protein
MVDAPGPAQTIQRLHAAFNAHDIEAFVACFDPGYKSEQPAHPDRTFQGSDQVRKNWSTIFDSMPDLQARLLSLIDDGETASVEWQWTGTQADGSAFHWRGACIFGVGNDRVTWGRLYMEPVEGPGGDIDATVGEMTQASDR